MEWIERSKESPLVEAAGKGDLARLRALLEAGANWRALDTRGGRPEELALRYGERESADMLRRAREASEEAERLGRAARAARAAAPSRGRKGM